ncbi:MAG: Ldh family oxidoreductase [Thaumarchaeota archaeon]|nr:Ldh family oxidoreductase [Nitrososphaerota archaeon]
MKNLIRRAADPVNVPSQGSPDFIEGFVDAEQLRTFLTQCFTGAGLKKPHADAVVDQLVVANLRGVDTHGVILTARYINAIKSGEINTDPKIRRLKVNVASEILDGDYGAGQYVAMRATKDAIALASRNGIGSVWVVNMSHVAMLAQFGIMIADRKMAGLLFTNSNAGVAPLGGREKVFGTNPLCYSFPYAKFPIVFDGATSGAAGMKIELYRMQGKQLPEGWAVDSEGRPTTDPSNVSALLPFGGHKGYALMFMVEMFSSALSGGMLSRELKYKNSQGGLYVQAIDIKHNRSYKDYAADLDRLAGMVKASAPPGGAGKVYLPGEIEFLTSELRKTEGIPVLKETWKSLVSIASGYGIDLPKLRIAKGE